jgi:hypothetical protein
MDQVRTTQPTKGYYIGSSGHHVSVLVPAGSVGDAGPEGHGELAGTRNVILVYENRDVVLPNLMPSQFEEIRDDE